MNIGQNIHRPEQLIGKVQKEVANLHLMLKELVAEKTNKQFDLIDALIGGINLYLEREGPFLLKQVFDVITKKEYDSFHISWVRHPDKLPISVTTSVCPWLNDYYRNWSFDKPQAVVSFSVIPSNHYTDVVCSWFNYCHDDSKWIQGEMKSTRGLESVINLFGISGSEDLCINIDFWENLEEKTKMKIISNMHHSMHKGSTVEVPLIIKLKN